jgi:hypothetical protein
MIASVPTAFWSRQLFWLKVYLVTAIVLVVAVIAVALVGTAYDAFLSSRNGEPHPVKPARTFIELEDLILFPGPTPAPSDAKPANGFLGAGLPLNMWEPRTEVAALGLNLTSSRTQTSDTLTIEATSLKRDRAETARHLMVDPAFLALIEAVDARTDLITNDPLRDVIVNLYFPKLREDKNGASLRSERNEK